MQANREVSGLSVGTAFSNICREFFEKKNYFFLRKEQIFQRDHKKKQIPHIFLIPVFIEQNMIFDVEVGAKKRNEANFFPQKWSNWGCGYVWNKEKAIHSLVSGGGVGSGVVGLDGGEDGLEQSVYVGDWIPQLRNGRTAGCVVVQNGVQGNLRTNHQLNFWVQGRPNIS